jgi:hypothetical protein
MVTMTLSDRETEKPARREGDGCAALFPPLDVGSLD